MVTWQGAAQEQFDSWSTTYDDSILQRLFFRPSHDRLLDVAHIRPHCQVLDVGCGTGRFARRLLGEFPDLHLTGVDISDGMLEKAKTNCSVVRDRLELIHGDAERLPFEDSTFDLVTCIHSFHHYPNQPAVVAEMHRVLKPEGQLIIVDGDRDRWWGWLVFDWVVTAIEGLVHHCSARQFRDIFRNGGFDLIHQVRCGRLAPFLITLGTARKVRKPMVQSEAA